jgi:hypothetical protein
MNSRKLTAMDSARNVLAICLFLLVSAGISGCGSGLAQVSGLVTLDGEPLRGGSGDTRVTVQFQPAGGNGSTAIGLADENGQYTLGTGAQTGIPTGEYLVSCSASRLVTAKDGKTPAGARRITDPKYANAKTSGMRFTVAPGNNVFDIALVSSPAGVSNRRVP